MWGLWGIVMGLIFLPIPLETIMTHDNFHPCKLDDAGLSSLQSLEKELGVVLMAINQDPAPAQLSKEQLGKLTELETQLQTTVIAYNTQ